MSSRGEKPLLLGHGVRKAPAGPDPLDELPGERGDAVDLRTLAQTGKRLLERLAGSEKDGELMSETA